LSTGPRTPEGKAKSSRNALKHGLLSSQILLEHENANELEALREELYAELQPIGALEGLLVEKVVTCAWLQRKALRVETAHMEERYKSVREALSVGGIEDGETSPLLATSSMLESTSLDRIQRYETSKERQMYRALHELQRLQAARQSAMALAPVALDVDLQGNGPSS